MMYSPFETCLRNVSKKELTIKTFIMISNSKKKSMVYIKICQFFKGFHKIFIHFNPFSAEILTTKVHPRAVREKIFITAIDP